MALIGEEIPNEPEIPVIDSILNSVKKLLGIEPDYVDFDLEILIHINAAILTLSQLGVGSYPPYQVTSNLDTYVDYLGEDSPEIPLVRTYLFYKTKLGFDPPQGSIVAESIKEMIEEIEWRLNVQVDSKKTFMQNGGEIS